MQFRSVLMVSLSSYLLLKNYLEDQTKVRAPLCKALYTHMMRDCPCPEAAILDRQDRKKMGVGNRYTERGNALPKVSQLVIDRARNRIQVSRFSVQ